MEIKSTSCLIKNLRNWYSYMESQIMYKTYSMKSGILYTIYTVKHMERILGSHSVDMRIILNILKTVMSVGLQS